MRWLSFSSDQPSFTAGHDQTSTTHASTGPAVAVAFSGDSSPMAVPDPAKRARLATGIVGLACYYGLADGQNCRVCGYCRRTYKPGCDHKRGAWCACNKQTELPEDDPDVIHEHVIEETY